MRKHVVHSLSRRGYTSTPRMATIQLVPPVCSVIGADFFLRAFIRGFSLNTSGVVKSEVCHPCLNARVVKGVMADTMPVIRTEVERRRSSASLQKSRDYWPRRRPSGTAWYRK
jgi:hypothetical protein